MRRRMGRAIGGMGRWRDEVGRGGVRGNGHLDPTSEEAGAREPKAAGADWTDERGTSEEGRRRLKGGRRRAGETQHTAGPSAGSPPGRGQRGGGTGRARGPGRSFVTPLPR